MRNIDSIIDGRLKSKLQTKANNANPSMQVVVTRPRTPIFDKRFWQETIVQSADTAVCTSVAVRKMGKYPDKIYAAYVTSAGNLIVKSATIRYPIGNMVWIVETTIPGCIACSIEFDGEYRPGGLNVEFYTEETPWIFYNTTAGELRAARLDGSYVSLSSANVIALDVVRGIASRYKDIDQGLIVFYIFGGAVYYRQLIAGVWQNQQQVTIAPDNAAQVKVERLFDYRICLHVTDAAGSLWEVFTKMAASSWCETEYITAGLSVKSKIIPINYIDKSEAEYVSVSLSAVSKILYALAPVLQSAANIDDGTGNYGLKVRLVFNENVFGENDNASSFLLTDDYGGAFGSTSAVKINNRTLEITFADFNNLQSPATLAYTPGTLIGDVVAVDAFSLEFIPTGLVPSALPQPAVTAVSNTDGSEIILAFDMEVNSADWAAAKAGFTITAQEYDMIEDGTASMLTYVIDMVSNLIDTDAGSIPFTGATLVDTVLQDGVIALTYG